MRRPAGPAYSLLRERPGGNVVVGITHDEAGPAPRAAFFLFDLLFFFLAGASYA